MIKRNIFNMPPRIITSSKKIRWHKIIKKGPTRVEDKGEIISIREQKREGKIEHVMYLTKRLAKIYGDYRGVSFFISSDKKYLGLEFTNETIDANDREIYLISTGTKRKNKIKASILNKIETKYYMQEELEFDLNNKILILPIKLKQDITENDIVPLVINEELNTTIKHNE